MPDRVTVTLGPLVDLAALEATLGPGTPEGSLYLWECGCALRFDAGEGAWRYATYCSEHEIDA